MTLTHDGKIAIWIEKKIKDSKWNKRRNFFNLGKNKTRTWSAKESYRVEQEADSLSVHGVCLRREGSLSWKEFSLFQLG